MFESISERLLVKMNSMFSKYHQLTCKETTVILQVLKPLNTQGNIVLYCFLYQRTECSADVVMLQRAFLQNERAATLEIKQRITGT